MADQDWIELDGVPGVRVTDTALRLDDDLDVEDWHRTLDLLANSVTNRSPWWIGDAVDQGRRFGVREHRSVTAPGYSNGTLRNFASFSKRIPPENRRADLPHGMHVPVASLDAELQPKWLQLAVDEGWNLAQFRHALKQTGAVTPRKTAAPEKPAVCPCCGRPF